MTGTMVGFLVCAVVVENMPSFHCLCLGMFTSAC